MAENSHLKHIESDSESDTQNKSCLKTNLLTILTVGGVILGGILGFVLRLTSDKWTEREIMYVSFFGDLFLRMLKSLILPLIVSSLVSAVANLDLSLSGKIARRAVCYYLTTTICAVILGIILVIIIAPGTTGNHLEQSNHSTKVALRNVTTVDTLLDLVRNLFPPNLIEACIRQMRTLLTPPQNASADIYQWDIDNEKVDGTNILGLVMFSAILGITLAKLGPKGKPLADLFESLTAAMMTITMWVIWLSPLGILFLVASKIIEIDDIEQLGGQLGMYFATVMLGIFIQGIIVLPLLYWILTRRNAFQYVANLAQALATAFGTSSSTATLPITIRCLEEKTKLDSRIVRFCLPIGATINMDGTALYEAVAAIFIAQVRGVDLSLGHLVAISITATAASIGAAGIPQAGLVTMVMVLDTVGLPPEDVTLIIAVDWLLDRFRTVINVMGDAFGAGVVDHFSREELNESHQNNCI